MGGQAARATAKYQRNAPGREGDQSVMRIRTVSQIDKSNLKWRVEA